uniref:peptidylprolyl isomerase n=1 Tax=Acrobeloides nanus TaxID=290746 RepID=A0A914DBI1_9BILA
MNEFCEENLNEEFFDAFSRRAVSSGSPSLDGSLDEERAVCSDSEVLNVLRSEKLSRQVKGPSSGDLEHECARERIQATKAEVLGKSCSHDGHIAHDHTKSGIDENGWEDLLGSGHLMQKILRAGHGERPASGQLVTIRVKCASNEFDNHEKLTFPLGYNFHIDAWDIGVQLMQLDEVSALKTTARFAYGELGLDNKIPPNQQQEYEIELLEIGEMLSFEDKTTEEAELFLETLKDRGNFHYKRKNYDAAVRLYKKGIDIIEKEILDSSRLESMLASLYANLSACHMKLNDWTEVLETTERSLALHGNNSKVLFRRAQAQIIRREYDDAIDLLKRAIKLDSSDKFMSHEC